MKPIQDAQNILFQGIKDTDLLMDQREKLGKIRKIRKTQR